MKIYNYFALFMGVTVLSSPSIASCSYDLENAQNAVTSINELSVVEHQSLSSYKWVNSDYINNRQLSSETDLKFLKDKISEFKSAAANNSFEVCEEIAKPLLPSVSIMKEFIRIELAFASTADKNISNTLNSVNCVQTANSCKDIVFKKFKADFSSFWNNYIYVNYPQYVSNYTIN